jgi:hypothetical protein
VGQATGANSYSIANPIYSDLWRGYSSVSLRSVRSFHRRLSLASCLISNLPINTVLPRIAGHPPPRDLSRMIGRVSLTTTFPLQTHGPGRSPPRSPCNLRRETRTETCRYCPAPFGMKGCCIATYRSHRAPQNCRPSAPQGFVKDDWQGLMGQDAVHLEVLATSGEKRERRHAGIVLRLLARWTASWPMSL